jgi:4'-phosphopantetheinyl transferase
VRGVVDSASDVVHVWLVSATVADAVASCLDDDERARAGRFKVEHAAVLYTAAHGALRVILGRCLDRAPDELRFDIAGTGKPFLVGDPSLRFNLSHSGELAVVAVAHEREVGVDVEVRRPVTRADGVARRIMTSDELARYQSLPTEERSDFLLWVWARKEALVKASGEGIRASLRSLACEPTTTDRFGVVDLDVPGYAAAVAAEGRDWTPVVHTFTAEE